VSGNRDRELTPEGQEKLRRARRLEWITIAYLVSAVGILALVLGSSQAMKTAWFEDLLSLIPPIAFLVSERYNSRAPTERFPYGFHRTVSVGHLCAALALFAMGGYLFVESVAKLVAAEHPTIGAITLFGQTFWLGWLMIPALLWSGLPAVFLGRAKMPLARDLHNKVLYADADMNKADWLTAGAAMVGVVGIGFGLWWADAAAAALISLDITKDGLKNLRHAVNDLMDQTPTTVAHDDVDPLRDRVAAKLNEFAWVEDAEVRLREEGQVYFGEAFVVPSDASDLTEKLEEALEELRDLDWRVHDVAIMPVRELPKRERE
jgi:cation diffusion facilitator family transporter